MKVDAVGSALELFFFFYVTYVLLDVKREDIPKYLLGYALSLIVVIVSNAYLSSIASFVYVMVMVFLLMWLLHEPFFKVLVTFVVATVLLMLIEMLLILILGPFIGTISYFVPVMLVITNGVMFIVVRRYKKALKANIDKYELRFMNYLMINIFFYVFTLKVVWDYNSEAFTDNMAQFLILVLLSIFVNYFAYKEVARISERNKRLEFQDEMHQTLEEVISEVKTRQHEYKNHLSTVQGILNTHEPDEACERIRSFLGDLLEIDSVDTHVLGVDRNIVRAVLFSKNNEADVAQIKMTYDVRCALSGIQMLDYEISIMLNNLLSNALDAAKQETDAERYVHLEVGFDKKHELYYFETRNSGRYVDAAQIPNFTTKFFSTKKKDAKERGIGLWTVRSLACKHSGSVEMGFEGDAFIVRVTFK